MTLNQIKNFLTKTKNTSQLPLVVESVSQALSGIKYYESLDYTPKIDEETLIFISNKDPKDQITFEFGGLVETIEMESDTYE